MSQERMPDISTEVISMRLPSRLELLSVLDRVADSVCERLEFDEDTRGQVTMSVIEAGTNAIQHGHRKDASKPLDVEFRVHPTVLEIAVHDTGTGFNPDDINGDVTTPEHLLDQRGRGLFIMRSCMDRVEYSFDRHGTLCRLFKNRPTKADNP
jgi:serine/threonine-protein kinase RsbW